MSNLSKFIIGSTNEVSTNEEKGVSQPPSLETASNQGRSTKLPESEVWAFVLTNSRMLAGLGSVLIYGYAIEPFFICLCLTH